MSMLRLAVVTSYICLQSAPSSVMSSAPTTDVPTSGSEEMTGIYIPPANTLKDDSGPPPGRELLHPRPHPRPSLHLRPRQPRQTRDLHHYSDPRRISPLGHAHLYARHGRLACRAPRRNGHHRCPSIRFPDEAVPHVPGWEELDPDAGVCK